MLQNCYALLDFGLIMIYIIHKIVVLLKNWWGTLTQKKGQNL